MKEINIAKTITAKRKEKGITQDELASYIGVSKASVSKWETEQSYPDITFLPQLAAYFNISIDELMGYSPQMTKDDIKHLYHRLSSEFSQKPFDQVISECESIIKKYYSCFPLLLQMAILLLNHYMLASEKEQQEEFLGEIIDLCMRIKVEGDDVRLSKQANGIHATCLLILSRPTEVLDILDEKIYPYPDEKSILANAHIALNDPQKAKLLLQSSIYEKIVTILGDAPLLIYSSLDNPAKVDEIIKRMLAFSDLFQIEKLNPNPVLILYLAIAQEYIKRNEIDLALEYLQKYADLCCKLTFPLVLRGDEFFDDLDSWLNELDLGANAPRDEKLIKESMLQSVSANPYFSALADHPRYQSIITNLKNNLGGI